jgi:phosphoribosylformimino-5-aminoimidazole carboxamide ribotide isomerase
VELIPAIDLQGGRAVRLRRGDFEAATDYGDPVEVARRWVREGATWLHVVDLDGAREGRPLQSGLIERLTRSAGVRWQVAGGMRDEATVAAALAGGADRVVLGTLLLRAPEIARALVERFGADRLAGGIDVRDGSAVGEGWREGAARVPLESALDSARRAGLRTVIVTGIQRDGLLAGPDLALLEEARRLFPDGELIASGGVGSLEDVRELAVRGFDGAILGRALYEGRFSLAEARQAAEGAGAPRTG